MLPRALIVPPPMTIDWGSERAPGRVVAAAAREARARRAQTGLQARFRKNMSDRDHNFLAPVSETSEEQIDRFMEFFFLTRFSVES